MTEQILKIGLAVTHQNRLLVVKKRGAPSYILPGGKPEQGEDDLQTLFREIEEELGCRLDARTVVFLGSFTDAAADKSRATVTVRLYAGTLVGDPSPRAEIEALEWLDPVSATGKPLAPSLMNQILPFLFSSCRTTAAA